MIKESEVLERIGQCVDDMTMDDLAEFYNYLARYDMITGDDIEPTEGWHLIPKEGAH